MCSIKCVDWWKNVVGVRCHTSILHCILVQLSITYAYNCTYICRIDTDD